MSPVGLMSTIFGLLATAAADDAQAHDFSAGSFFKNLGAARALRGHIIEKSTVTSFVDCGLKCLSLLPDCRSFNYVAEITSKFAICEINNNSKNCAQKDDFVQRPSSEYFEPTADVNQGSCSVCQNSGTYIKIEEEPGFKCVCQDGFEGDRCQDTQVPSTEDPQVSGYGSYVDGVWILIARFSNNDGKNWMGDQASWWYDRVQSYGNTLDPSSNADMISKAFWCHQGSEFRITKSNDPTHTALLTTTGNCLNRTTFRSKMASYGIFRNDDTWASNKCQGSCSVSYGGNYVSVQGFSQSRCNGDIQSKNKIGFWCDYSTGDGAVLMIGGGGSTCGRADHGIGITEADSASFKTTTNELDFGDHAHSNSQPTKSYSLNLWVR